MKKRTNSESTINFIFFLSNHPGMTKVINSCFDPNLASHFNSKLSSIIGQDSCCKPEHIIKFIGELSQNNKEIILDWIEQNYDCGF